MLNSYPGAVRLLAALASIALVPLLAGCGGGGSATVSASAGASASASPTCAHATTLIKSLVQAQATVNATPTTISGIVTNTTAFSSKLTAAAATIKAEHWDAGNTKLSSDFARFSQDAINYAHGKGAPADGTNDINTLASDCGIETNTLCLRRLATSSSAK